MKTIENLSQDWGLPLDVNAFINIGRISVSSIRFGYPTRYPIKPNLFCLLGRDKDIARYSCSVIAVPEGNGYYMIAGERNYLEALATGAPMVPAIVVKIEKEMVAAIRRALNNESLSLRDDYTTLFQLLDFFDNDGAGFGVRKDDGSLDSLYRFVAEATNEHEESVMMAHAIHRRKREDIKEMLYDGRILLDDAFDFAVADEMDDQ